MLEQPNVLFGKCFAICKMHVVFPLPQRCLLALFSVFSKPGLHSVSRNRTQHFQWRLNYVRAKEIGYCRARFVVLRRGSLCQFNYIILLSVCFLGFTK
jgi:hypothetical protein